MDFSLSPGAVEFRAEVKAFIAEHLTAEVVTQMHATGTFNDKAFNAALADAGLLAGAVPGYGDRDPIELYILFNELEKAGAPYDGLAVTMLVAGVVNAAGTDFHRSQVLQKLLTGRFNCCLGYSDVDDHGARVRLGDPAHPDQPGRAKAQGPHHVPGPHGYPGHRGPAGPDHGHRTHKRHLLRRRARRR